MFCFSHFLETVVGSNAHGPMQKTEAKKTRTLRCEQCLSSALQGVADFSIHHLSGLRLKIVLRCARMTGCSLSSFARRLSIRVFKMSCLRRNCSDNLWCLNDRHLESPHALTCEDTPCCSVCGSSSSRIFPTFFCDRLFAFVNVERHRSPDAWALGF